jgi:cell division protein FtsB
MRKRLFFLLAVIVGTYLIIVLSRDLLEVLSARKRITQVEKEVVGLKEENLKLREELKWVEKPEFVEKKARDKLLLGKEGEVVVVLPEEIDRIQAGISDREVEEEKELENWEKWAQVFGFYK